MPEKLYRGQGEHGHGDEAVIGFEPRCRVCERHTHAKWHDVASGDINPIALLQLLDRLNDDGTGVVEAVRGWVVIMAGIDVALMRAMLESEQRGLRGDPVARSTSSGEARDTASSSSDHRVTVTKP